MGKKFSQTITFGDVQIEISRNTDFTIDLVHVQMHDAESGYELKHENWTRLPCGCLSKNQGPCAFCGGK